jgi:hypothetical protein
LIKEQTKFKDSQGGSDVPVCPGCGYTAKCIRCAQPFIESPLRLTPSMLYRAVKIGNDEKFAVFLVGQSDMQQALEDQRLWWDSLAGRLFFCDQCDYFSSSAQAVQEHSEQQHDCHFETYYTVDELGAQHVRVKTIKCHARPSRGCDTAANAWRALEK